MRMRNQLLPPSAQLGTDCWSKFRGNGDHISYSFIDFNCQSIKLELIGLTLKTCMKFTWLAMQICFQINFVHGSIWRSPQWTLGLGWIRKHFRNIRLIESANNWNWFEYWNYLEPAESNVREILQMRTWLTTLYKPGQGIAYFTHSRTSLLVCLAKECVKNLA